MIQILHNVSCSKSRAAVEQMQTEHIECNIRNFIESPLNAEEINDLLKKLQRPVLDIVRTNEALFQEQYANQNLGDEELINLLVQHPSLMQRPIVIKDDKAIIGRPAHLIDEFLNS